MSGIQTFLARVVAIALTLGVMMPVSSTVMLYPTEAAAKAPKKSTLPKPYVSKALKAVLMPVTKEVARKFRLAKGAKGVMVVSVKPDGIGKLAGLKPGDVISTILGRQVKKPSDVDTIIAYFLGGGTNDYNIGGTRKNGRTYRATTYITPTYFYEPVDVYTLSSWNSFSYETYSYSEYVSYYSQDIYTSYERSETYIQETITETSFVSEMASETSYEYTSYDEQVIDGSYVEGGTGSVWQDGESEVVYDTADDPTMLEVPLDSAADDADPFTADQGDPDYAAAAAEADAGDAADPSLYDDASAAAPDPTAEDPSASEDPAPSEEPAASEDPAPSEDPAMTEDASSNGDPVATEDTSASEDPVVAEDPSASEDPSATEDAAATEDPMPSEDPAQDQGYSDQPADQGTVDDGSSADPQCIGEMIDGVCIDTSSDTGSGDAGGYQDTSGGDAGGYEDTGGGDSGGGEEYIPEQ